MSKFRCLWLDIAYCFRLLSCESKFESEKLDSRAAKTKLGKCVLLDEIYLAGIIKKLFKL